MDDMNAFERQVAGEFVRRAGPVRQVDAAAIFTTITATQSPKWRFRSMFSATKFVVAGAIVALFGGFLLAGVLTQPSDEQPPAATDTVTQTEEPASVVTGHLDADYGSQGPVGSWDENLAVPYDCRSAGDTVCDAEDKHGSLRQARGVRASKIAAQRISFFDSR